MRNYVPAVNSTLSANALTGLVLPEYDIGPSASCRLLYIGVNDSYAVTGTDAKRYVLRIYRATWRTLEDILYELDALRYLHEKGVSVSMPLARKSGEYTYPIEAAEGKRYAVLFTHAKGQEPTYADRNQAIRYGTAVANIHAASVGFSSAHPRSEIDLSHLIVTSLKSIEPFLLRRVDDWKYLRMLSDRLIAALDKLPIGDLEKGFCHGDLHGWNANIDDDGVVTFYDFDCCGLGWRAYDVGVFRWASRLRGTEKELWPAYLEGYLGVRRLAEIDILAAPVFIPVRHIWMMGLNTFLARFFGDNWVSDSYFDREIGFLRSRGTEELGPA
jgi:Ser/Thr protein kinase RdoA (MazF antagonist)